MSRQGISQGEAISVLLAHRQVLPGFFITPVDEHLLSGRQYP
jgi:hypothetical protein